MYFTKQFVSLYPNSFKYSIYVKDLTNYQMLVDVVSGLKQPEISLCCKNCVTHIDAPQLVYLARLASQPMYNKGERKKQAHCQAATD